MSDQCIAVTRFDSEAVEPRLRYDAWRENMGVAFDVFPSTDSSPCIIRPASIEAADLGGMVFVRVRAGSQVFSRDLRRLRRDGLGLILVQYFSHGGGTHVGGERLRPGDMQIIDTEQPYEMVTSDFENYSLLVPYDLRGTISPVLETLHGRPIAGGNPMVRLLGDHLLSLWRNIPDMSPAQSSTAAQGTLGLLRGWLANEPGLHGDLEPAVAESLGAAICRYIEQHLSQPLRAEDLARCFRVSRMQVYRLFRPHGGVVRYLWERRLQRAHAMLSSALYQQRSIGAIAFECGFNSEAHFSRAFRARFGQTAREIRAHMADRASPELRQVVGGKDYSTDLYWMIRRFAMAGTVDSRDQ